MEINAAMRGLLADAAFLTPLEPALSEIIDSGFVIRSGCHFMADLLSKAESVTRSNFQDCTGYECFVNSIHIEDYDDRAPLCQALQFVVKVFAAWRTFESSLTLISIVSVADSAVVVKFHVQRPTERWLSENIEGYDDAVMLVRSSEELTTLLQNCSASDK